VTGFVFLKFDKSTIPTLAPTPTKNSHHISIYAVFSLDFVGK